MTELKISIISDKFWERIKVNWDQITSLNTCFIKERVPLKRAINLK